VRSIFIINITTLQYQYYTGIENLEVIAFKMMEHTKKNFTESEYIGQITLCRYAEKRGVNVLAEIDVPGHARSW
jgi:N-acetyl-beta-hexosaminidase